MQRQIPNHTVITDQFVLFFRKQSVFSNFYPAIFKLDGNTFVNSEQAYMYEKAKMSKDQSSMSAIMNETNPAKIKRLGRQVRNFDPVIWDQYKFSIMVKINYAKFNQNRDLGDKLIATGTRILAEASPRDKIWGIGLAADHPDALCIWKWRGQNLLGKALMKNREMINLEGA